MQFSKKGKEICSTVPNKKFSDFCKDFDDNDTTTSSINMCDFSGTSKKLFQKKKICPKKSFFKKKIEKNNFEINIQEFSEIAENFQNCQFEISKTKLDVFETRTKILDFLNFFFQCSLKGDLSICFTDTVSKEIIFTYTKALCTFFIFLIDEVSFKDNIILNKKILSHFLLMKTNFLIICDYILSKIDQKDNIWVTRLSSMITSDILHEYHISQIKCNNQSAAMIFSSLSMPSTIPLSINKCASFPEFKNEILKILNRNTLVLDLDETLISYEGGLCRVRPYLSYFMEKVSPLYEIVVFTASIPIYADTILDTLDPDNKYFSKRLYRNHATQVGETFVKDLTKIRKDLSKIVIVDNMNESFNLQSENGILIAPFDGVDETDVVLKELGDILEKIATESHCVDIRIKLKEYKVDILKKVSRL